MTHVSEGLAIPSDYVRMMAQDGHANVPAFLHSTGEMFRDIDLAGKRVLEIGSGKGLLAVMMGLQGAERVVSLEPEMVGATAGVIAVQRERVEALRLSNVDVVVGDFNTWEGAAGSFDVIVSRASINHLQQSDRHALRHSETYANYVAVAKRIHEPARARRCVHRHRRVPVRLLHGGSRDWASGAPGGKRDPASTGGTTRIRGRGNESSVRQAFERVVVDFPVPYRLAASPADRGNVAGQFLPEGLVHSPGVSMNTRAANRRPDIALPGMRGMSITAMVWAILYCGLLLSSVANPLFGSLGYLLEYYMRPQLKWWGDDLPDLRYNLIISVVLGVTFFMRRGSLREMREIPNPALKWLLALGAVMLFVTFTVSVDTGTSWNWMVQWVKMAIIFPLLVVGVIRSRNAFNLFVVTNFLGAFWWGWQAWVDPKREQSRLLNIGSGDTLNDNCGRGASRGAPPFAIIYLLTEKDKRLRGVALVATPFIMNTIILCNSRGATVALIVAMAAGFVLIRNRYRLRMVAGAVAVAASVFMLADQQFLDRQQTTTDYEEDGSAQQRLTTWNAAYRLVKDRPLGAGGRGFHLLSPIYIPDIVEAHRGDLRAPHNTWVMVPCEWGILGLICFIGIYASAFLMLQRVKKRATDDEKGFYYWRAFAIQLSIVGFLVAGFFTDRLYAEIGYWMVALSYSLYRLQFTEQAEEASRRWPWFPWPRHVPRTRRRRRHTASAVISRHGGRVPARPVAARA